jgi:hypothetical protein
MIGDWMVTDNQVRKLMKLIQTEESYEMAAAKAGMDEKTARRYRRLGRVPSELKRERGWRTHKDAFEEIWPEVVELLERESGLEAATLFEHLNRKYEGRFQAGQLRTLQRRVKVWRGRHGAAREVFFPQEHRPGEQAQSDFTHMKELGVTICGELFDHLLYHLTLTYSNWESVTICFSESFESLQAGLQNGLWELGAVPEEHRTDSLSAAVNNLKDEDEFTARYKGLLSHYELRASHSSPGRPNENGDVEQSHHRFKKAVEQELMLRGSRDFRSREEYEEFLKKLLRRRNAGRRERLGAEMLVMRELPERRLEDYTKESVKVTRNSTISVRKNIYSAPSQLIRERVEVRVHTEHLEIWYGGALVEQMKRLRGQGGQAINYRHVIDSLVRKPGAFANYQYRESLFPRLLFRVAYDQLREHYPATAERQYVRLLWLAANVGEERVNERLRQMVASGERITAEGVSERLKVGVEQTGPPAVEISPIDLCSYDSLMAQAGEVAA